MDEMKVTSKKDNGALCYCNSVIRTKYTHKGGSIHCIAFFCVLLFLVILQYL